VEESEEEWESSEHSDQLPKESSDKRGLPEVEKFRMVEQPKAPTCLLERLQIGEGIIHLHTSSIV
jgi:hypothetical protein